MEKYRFKQLLESQMGNVKPLINEDINDFPICVRSADGGKVTSNKNGSNYILVRKAHTNEHGEKLDYKWFKDGTLGYAVADDYPDKDMAGRIVDSKYYYCKCVNKKCVPKVVDKPRQQHECSDQKKCD